MRVGCTYLCPGASYNDLTGVIFRCLSIKNNSTNGGSAVCEVCGYTSEASEDTRTRFSLGMQLGYFIHKYTPYRPAVTRKQVISSMLLDIQ